jgi:hypothetical protein
MSTGIYATTFCNRGHKLSNGYPVGHECYVLDRKKLADEREGREVRGSMIKQPVTISRGGK